MRDCPHCNIPVDGLTCPKCGFTEATTIGMAASWQCCHDSRGQRCANAGVYSPSTHGGGPWFCQQHHPYSPTLYGPRRPKPADVDLRRAAGHRVIEARPLAVVVEEAAERLALQSPEV